MLLLMIRALLRRGVEPRRILFVTGEVITDFRELLSILGRGEEVVVLDEVTFVPEWERALKVAIDQGWLDRRTVYASGSTTAFLRRETFPGRPIRFLEMLPLDFRRFCLLFGSLRLRRRVATAKSYDDLYPLLDELNRLFAHYLRCGGFPRAMYEEMEEGGIRDETYEAVVNWILGDVLKLGRSRETAIAILRALLRTYGTRFSLNALRKELAIGSHRTVREYLELLSDLFVIRQYFQYRRSTPLLRRERKVYFTDPFLLHVIEHLLFGASIVDESLVVEGVVAEHLRRAHPPPAAVGFYVGPHRETDFQILPVRLGVEVKWRRHVHPTDFPNPRRFHTRLLLSRTTYDPNSPTPIIPTPLYLATLCIPSQIPYRLPPRPISS